jgi:hypothetical protein
MWEDKKPGRWRMLVMLWCGFLILGLAACNLPSAGVDDPEPTVTGGESQDIELEQQEQALRKGECPEPDSMYELVYDHELVLNSPDVEDMSYHFEWEEKQPADFNVWFYDSGRVDNIDLTNPVTINVSGWVKTGDDDCPINYIHGAWPLTADIQGTCKKGIVTLHVEEHFEDVTLTGSCGDPLGPGPGLYSAPEVDLTFDLSIPMTNDGIMGGSRDSMMYLKYWYELKLPDKLDLVPLPVP